MYAWDNTVNAAVRKHQQYEEDVWNVKKEYITLLGDPIEERFPTKSMLMVVIWSYQ